RSKRFRNVTRAFAVAIAIAGLVSRLSDTVLGSSTNAAFGIVSALVFVVFQRPEPEPSAAVQPAGRAGATTASKASDSGTTSAASGNEKATDPKSVPPSCRCRVATTVPPQLPEARNV